MLSIAILPSVSKNMLIKKDTKQNFSKSGSKVLHPLTYHAIQTDALPKTYYYIKP